MKRFKDDRLLRRRYGMQQLKSVRQYRKILAVIYTLAGLVAALLLLVACLEIARHT